MSTNKLITNSFKIHNVKQFIESVDESSNTIYYVSAGNHLPYSNGDSMIPEQNNSVYNLMTDTYQNMIFAKQITTSDLKIMIDANLWEQNKYFDMYDDKDVDLYSKSYFTYVDEGAYFHVYKCLYNNNGANSTIQPTFADVTQEANLFENDDGYYETSDKYQWKYMYSIDAATYSKFSTDRYIPIVANNTVSLNAKDGAIDVIKVISSGSKYDNYFSGIFNGGDIQISSNVSLDSAKNYAIGSNGASVNGFYNDCIIHITEGDGKGEYRTIVNYINDGSNKILVVNSAFSNISSTSEYEISPSVLIRGDGISPTVARAIINPSGNTVEYIRILDRGEGYRFAFANVIYSNVVSVTSNCIIQPIISPFGGHGFNPETELNGINLGISVTFSNNENDTISTYNDFRNISIVKNPKFANVDIIFKKPSDNTDGSDGTFLLNEDVYQIKTKHLYGTVSVNSTSSTIIGSNTDFNESLSSNSILLIESGINHYLTNVQSITNSTQISVSTNGFFVNSSASVYVADILAKGTIYSIGFSNISANSVEGFFETDRKIIGLRSGATANVQTININKISRNGGYLTMNQMAHAVGNVVSGEFIEDELIYQVSSSYANAYVHSVEDNNSNTQNLYMTNKMGTFNSYSNIIGVSSGAIFNPTEIHKGDFDYGSGEVIYTQNDGAVSRSNTQAEIIKIIIGF